MTWQEEHIRDGERMIAFARSQMPGQIGGVATHLTTELDEIPLTLLGDHPPTYNDRHRGYEDDFNALVELQVQTGRVSQEIGDLAVANFHDYMQGPNRTAPRFY